MRLRLPEDLFTDCHSTPGVSNVIYLGSGGECGFEQTPRRCFPAEKVGEHTSEISLMLPLATDEMGKLIFPPATRRMKERYSFEKRI